MALENNLTKQLAILADVKKQSPGASHVYLRRTDMNDSIVDIPMAHVEQTLRIHPQWEVLMSSQQMNREVEKLFEDDANSEPQVPLVEDDGSEEQQMFADEHVVKGLNDDVPPLPPKPSAKKPRKATKRATKTKTHETA